MTVISTVSVVHGDPKLTANVPRVLLIDVTVKVAVPPPVTVCEAGVTFKLIGAIPTTVPVFVAWTVIVAELPPLFLIEIEEGSAESMQPGPPPLMGGPTVPDEPAGQSGLLS